MDLDLRARAFLLDDKVPIEKKQQALKLLMPDDPASAARAFGFLTDTGVPLAKKQAALDLIGGPKEPAGTRADFVRDMKDFAVDQAIPAAVATGATALAGPEAGLATRALFAGGGQVIGKGIQRGLRGEPVEDIPPTPTGGAVDFGTGVAGEVGSSAILGLVQRLFGKPAAMGATELARKAAAQREGIDTLAGDVNPKLSGLETELSNTLGGARPVNEALAKRGLQTRDALERNTVDQMGGPRSTIEGGIAAREAAMPTLARVKAREQLLFQRATKTAHELGVEAAVPSSLAKDAQDVIDEMVPGLDPSQQQRARAVLEKLANRGKPFPGNPPQTIELPILDASGNPIKHTIPGTPDHPAAPMSLDELIQMKSDFNHLLPEFRKRGFATTQAGGTLEHFAKEIDDTIDSAAAGTPVQPLWRRARDFHKENLVPLRDVADTLSGMQGHDDAVVDRLIRAGRPQEALTYFSHLEQTGAGQAQADELRSAWWGRELNRYYRPESGFDAGGFLKRWDALGPELQGVLKGRNPDNIENLVDLMRGQALNTAAGRTVSGRTFSRVLQTGRMLGAGGAAAKAVYDLATGGGGPGEMVKEMGAAAVPFLIPNVLARAVTSGRGRAYLTGGITAPSYGPAAVRLALQAAAGKGRDELGDYPASAVRLSPDLMEQLLENR